MEAVDGFFSKILKLNSYHSLIYKCNECFHFCSIYSTQIYVEDCIRVFKNDGTEQLTIQIAPVTASNGVLSGQSGFYTYGWANTGDWQLEFDYKFDGVGGIVILTVPGATQRGYNLIQLESYTNTISTYNNGSWGKQSVGTVPRGSWEHLVCVKQGTSVSITTLNQTKTVSWNSISDPVLTTGLDGWQDTVHMKNIKLKSL